MKKQKILCFVIVLIMSIAFAAPAFAANAPGAEVGKTVTQADLQRIAATGEKLLTSRTSEDGVVVETWIEKNDTLPVPFANIGEWYNLGVRVTTTSGELVGEAVQPAYIGYVQGYYFGSLNPMTANSYNGWTPHSITSSGGWGQTSVWINAYWAKNGAVRGSVVEYFIDAGTGVIYSRQLQ